MFEVAGNEEINFPLTSRSIDGIGKTSERSVNKEYHQQ